MQDRSASGRFYRGGLPTGVRIREPRQEVRVKLRPGETVLGRYEVRAVAPPVGGMLQARAWDRQTSTWVQILAPDATARLRPGAAARFARAGDAVDGPALLPREDLGLHDGIPLALREDGARPVPAAATCSHDDAWNALCSLAPEVIASAHALDGEFDGRDLALDADGRLLLAPSGVVRAESLSVLPHHRAPETWDTSSDNPAATALYGLGAWLFHAASGMHPVAAQGLRGLREGQASPRSLASVDPSAPPHLVEALTGLLSTDPMRRLEVAAELPAAAPGTPLLSIPATTPRPVQASAPEPPSTSEDRALRGWLVVADLAQSTRTVRRRLAALADIDPTTVESAFTAQEPLPLIEGLRNEATAEAAMLPFERAGVDVQARLAPDPPTGRRVAALGLGGAGGLGLVGALALLPLGVPYALMAALPASLLVMGAAFLAASSQRDLRALRALTAGANRMDESPSISQPQASLAAARRALYAPDVPEAIRIDLETTLDELEDALDADPTAAATDIEAAARRVEDAVRGQRGDSDVDARVRAADSRARAAAKALSSRS